MSENHLKSVDMEKDPISVPEDHLDLEVTAAPPFELPIAQGGVFNLSSVLQRGPVILNFIRGTWCPYCQVHMGNLRKWQKSISLKSSHAVTIVVISNETTKTIREWLKHNNVTFLFLSDAEGTVTKNYGVFDDEKISVRPATFLIESDGRIKIAHQGKRNDSLEGKIVEQLR